MTKRINGGTIGLEDRKKHWEHALDVFGGDFESHSVDRNQVVKKGSRGALVTEIQERLNINPADGIFGPGTEEIIKIWQEDNGLYPDGIVGPKTIEKLLG
jgi:peptidoglycan hydrolase-like protein with peptidoglycan-binding domain